MCRAATGSAFAAACGLAATFFLSAPIPATAQQVDAAALTECLIANTTDDHIIAMKKLMIAALSDDIEGLKAEATNYGKHHRANGDCELQYSGVAAQRPGNQRSRRQIWTRSPRSRTETPACT